MKEEQTLAAKGQMVALMQAGHSWQAAATMAGIQISRSAAYRLLQKVRTQGEAGLLDGRHGHPAKLQEPVQQWLKDYCQAAPGTPSHIVQQALQNRFGVSVSISHLNATRAVLGLGSRATPLRKKKLEANSGIEPQWQEGAGGLLLLAAVQETNLLPSLEAALASCEASTLPRLAHLSPPSRWMLLLTLLFLGAVGLRRTWDLRGYSGNGLGVLTGRKRAYGYAHVERFLSQLARAGGAEIFTSALGKWTAYLWQSRAKDETTTDSSPCFYVDGHRKPVYTEKLIPRGLIGRTGKILGCRALVLLHDEWGHPLQASTNRGDQHLTIGLPQILACMEENFDTTVQRRVVVDREGMAAPFIRDLQTQGYTVITLLRTDQYDGLESFSEVGPFVPLEYDQHRQVIREVAPARFALPLPDQPDQFLALRVALIRDHRRQVPASKGEEEDEEHDKRFARWREGWKAQPSPASPTTAKLIPVVTTAETVDAGELAQTYIRRWPVQENIIRDCAPFRHV